MERLLKIDIFRGLLLIIMVANHTPSPMRNVTTQPLGFVSAAEAFVFISAFLCGLIFSRKLQSNGLQAIQRISRKRMRTIYKTHLLTLLFCFVVIGNLSHYPAFYNMIHHYLEHSLTAVISALLLLYQPSLLDILPMYLVFLALTPWLLTMLVRFGELQVLAISAFLWCIAQYGVKAWMLGIFAGSWWVLEPGAFDLLAWQFLWVGGLVLGRRFQARPESLPQILPKSLLPLLGGIAIFFFCCRWPWIPIYLELGSYEWLLDKWQLGPLRLVNFLALLALITWFAPFLSRLLQYLQPLALVGRHTLPLFALHLCFSLLATGCIETYELSDIWCYTLLALHIALLFCTALLLERFSNRPIRQRPTAHHLIPLTDNDP